MVLKLTKISLWPLAGTLTCAQGIIGLIVGFIAAVGSVVNPDGGEGIFALGLWAIVVLPVVNAILGFLTAVFISLCYNGIVKMFGGIELEFEQQDQVASFKHVNV